MRVRSAGAGTATERHFLKHGSKRCRPDLKSQKQGERDRTIGVFYKVKQWDTD